jgi:DNA-directed RNA polymerase alpha subunit
MAMEQTESAVEGFPHAISNPATHALQQAGFFTLQDLTRASADELLALHGFGPKALRILQVVLEGRGLALAPSAPKTKKQQLP